MRGLSLLLLQLITVHATLITRHSHRNHQSAYDESPAGQESLYDVITVTSSHEGYDVTNIQSVNELRGAKELTCEVCDKIALVISDLLEAKVSVEVIEKIAVKVCVYKKYYSAKVCEMGVAEWKKDFMFIAERTAFLPKDMCGYAFPDECPAPIFPPVNWTVQLPDVPKPPFKPMQQPPSGAPTLKVLHLSDIHVDPYYLEGSKADCDMPLCCRAVNGKPSGPSDAAWSVGSLSNCDTPPSTLEALLSKLSREKFDLVLFTGDIPPHDVYNQTVSSQVDVIGYINRLLIRTFPHTPVLQAVGNHEAHPVDQFIPPYTGPDGQADPMSWLYRRLAKFWTHWLPQNTTETILKGGYWSWEVFPSQLKVISVNSGYGSTMDWFVRYNNTDAAGQLQWLVHQLQDCETRGVKAWILAHHPRLNLQDWERQYHRILARYASSISSLFYGHTHRDHFTVYMDPELGPVLSGHIAPSVTPYSAKTGVNMGYHVLTLDGVRNTSTFGLLDFSAYILNLTKAHESGRMEWELEYRASESYGVDNLFPASAADLLDRFRHNATLAGLYNYFQFKSTNPLAPCAGQCLEGLVNDATIDLSL